MQLEFSNIKPGLQDSDAVPCQRIDRGIYVVEAINGGKANARSLSRAQVVDGWSPPIVFWPTQLPMTFYHPRAAPIRLLTSLNSVNGHRSLLQHIGDSSANPNIFGRSDSVPAGGPTRCSSILAIGSKTFAPLRCPQQKLHSSRHPCIDNTIAKLVKDRPIPAVTAHATIRLGAAVGQTMPGSSKCKMVVLTEPHHCVYFSFVREPSAGAAAQRVRSCLPKTKEDRCARLYCFNMSVEDVCTSPDVIVFSSSAGSACQTQHPNPQRSTPNLSRTINHFIG